MTLSLFFSTARGVDVHGPPAPSRTLANFVLTAAVGMKRTQTLAFRLTRTMTITPNPPEGY